MPIRNDSDLHRITADLAKARQRLAEMESGQRGVNGPSAGPATLTGRHTTETAEQYAARNPHAGRALENQMNAKRADIARLESEYLNAMLAERRWTPAGIIERMTAK